MADAIQNKRGYLRQVQQEQAQKKRDLMAQQKEDMRALRQYYKQESKNIDSESAAAVNHIKSESAEIAHANKMERMEQASAEREARQQEADDLRAERQISRSPASRTEDNGDEATEESIVEKKSLYNRKAQKLTTLQNHETRENDDFYRVQNRGSRVSESNQGYVIEAYAPEHEKDNLRVSIQRNKAVVSGQRKFADEAQEGAKTMKTNNFQTFREEFKFERPITSEGITRERVGDYVRFTIPKLESIDHPNDEA